MRTRMIQQRILFDREMEQIALKGIVSLLISFGVAGYVLEVLARVRF